MEKETLFIGGKFIGHDSSIFVIFPEEKEIFGIETERLTRFKHDNLYPIPAIKRLLDYKKIDPLKVKRVRLANSFTSQKEQMFLVERYKLQLAERKHFGVKYKGELKEKLKAYDKLNIISKALNLTKSTSGLYLLKHRIQTKLFGQRNETLDQAIKKHLQNIFPQAEIKNNYYDHEYCHALSSYYSSTFTKAILFAYDGWGDGDFSKVYLVDQGKFILYTSSAYSPMDLSGKNNRYLAGCSIGGIYSYFTEMLGFEPEQDEGKVEALAAYGNWHNDVYENLIKLARVNQVNKSIEIDKRLAMAYFNYDKMQNLLASFKKEDLAAAVQKFLEEITLAYLKFIVEDIGFNNLCLSGGVVANVIMNKKIYETITKNLQIVPAMADDGTAQGAAIAQLLNHGYSYQDLKWLKDIAMPYFSTSYDKNQVLELIKNFSEQINWQDLGENWTKEAAKLLVEGKIGAIFQGKMEWGPRALGNRSIIADARRPEFRERINKQIKRRPYFQPFCPTILAEEKDRLFDQAYLNKHMTCAFLMKKEFQSKLPSAIHIDGTARVQFIEERDNPPYYRLLKKVKELTGYGVIINTSFNKHGRTIVESPQDAITDFLETDMDYLIIEGIKITRK